MREEVITLKTVVIGAKLSGMVVGETLAFRLCILRYFLDTEIHSYTGKEIFFQKVKIEHIVLVKIIFFGVGRD